MKTLFFIATICILTPGKPALNYTGSAFEESFSHTAIKKNNADTASLNGQWYLQPLLAADTATGKFPVLRFNLPAGTFSGNTGCNNMSGSFQKTDSSLVFNQNIMTTKMACTGYDETAFIKSLLRTNRYKMEKGVLILMFDATELSRWTRKPDRQVKMKRA